VIDRSTDQRPAFQGADKRMLLTAILSD